MRYWGSSGHYDGDRRLCPFQLAGRGRLSVAQPETFTARGVSRFGVPDLRRHLQCKIAGKGLLQSACVCSGTCHSAQVSEFRSQTLWPQVKASAGLKVRSMQKSVF